MNNLECKMNNYFQFNFSYFAAKKRNRKSSPLRLNPLKFHCLRWTKINSLRSDSIFVLTASTIKFLNAI